MREEKTPIFLHRVATGQAPVNSSAQDFHFRINFSIFFLDFPLPRRVDVCVGSPGNYNGNFILWMELIIKIRASLQYQWPSCVREQNLAKF